MTKGRIIFTGLIIAIKINGKWYNIDATTAPTPPTPPTPSANNYWVNDQVLAAPEARAERANDRRVVAWERAQKMRERDLERAAETWERAEEQREAVLERAEEQREASLEHASEQREQYYDMRDRLIPLLKADGYMKSDRSKVTIKMTPTDIFINGKKLADAQEGKYCDIVSDYISRKGDVKKIIIKSGYLHVSQKGDEHNSSFTHNENQ